MVRGGEGEDVCEFRWGRVVSGEEGEGEAERKGQKDAPRLNRIRSPLLDLGTTDTPRCTFQLSKTEPVGF